MLNLSDKELDRLSREAAQEHDPGDITGPRSWDRLEVRLDRDMGRVNPNLFRGVRRLPFYYAPAILLILGVGYYFVRSNTQKAGPPGSPPVTMVKPISPGETNQTTNVQTTDSLNTKNAAHTDNSTSTPNQPTATLYPVSPGQPLPAAASGNASSSGSTASSGNPGNASSSGSTTSSGKSVNPSLSEKSATIPSAGSSSANSSPRSLSGSSPAPSSGSSAGPSSATASSAAPGNAPKPGKTAANSLRPSGAPMSSTRDHTFSSGDRLSSSNNHLSSSGNHSSHHRITPPSPGRQKQTQPSNDKDEQTASLSQRSGNNNNGSGSNSSSSGNTSPASTNAPSRELTLTSVQWARSTKRAPAVDDSGLRTITAKTSPDLLIKKKGVLRINRSLQIGLSLAPDFASVNSLAGDRPGSSFGLTLDYQFANRWYLGTGLLFSRKNYAARAQDYHAPYDFYRTNNLHNIDFVKGTFNMLEIPLNLRYDFSVTGNTVFFASVGLSSYLFGAENCNYYFDSYGSQDCRSFHYPNKENSLFSAANLSIGVEAGVGNNLSLLVAPYMKIPTRNLGFGQIQMNSVGINFALKFAPVLSRKRR